MKIKKVNKINYLIISSTFDYSTDLICYELEKRKKKYLRLNRDCFTEYNISYNLEEDSLFVQVSRDVYKIENENLFSVFFRAPVFLRSMSKLYSLEEQLQRSQWSSFIRNLTVFNKAKWINHPFSIYGAENKLYQLSVAKSCGLNIPVTHVGNYAPESIQLKDVYAVKSIDTALFYDDGQELFTYTSMMTGKELFDAELKDAPLIIQEYLQNKLDIRVTIVGNLLFPVSITSDNQPIVGDWRKLDKDILRYSPIELPSEIQSKIMDMMNLLKLSFGGMDLALVGDEYYFIEVNPTGEWGWLVNTTGLSIDKSIVDLMISGGRDE